MGFNVAVLGGGVVSRVHLETLLHHPAVALVSMPLRAKLFSEVANYE